jgi:hypothetical protein
MLCRRCGQAGVFDVTCTTATKVYRRRECRACVKISKARHAVLSKGVIYPAACECCGTVGRVVLDHCHLTHALRGFLCIRCNRAIGSLGDTRESLQRALDYLVR